MTLRIALVDDELTQLHTIHMHLSSALQKMGIEIKCMDSYNSATTFLTAFQPDSYDIILLDIYMDADNGVDVARRLRQQDSQVVLAFCTSSNEFAAESYEVGAGYYLQKPVSEEKLTAMLRRLDLSRIERNRTITLPDGYKCLLRQVLYTEYSNHTVTFFIQDTPPHSVYMNHADAEKLLLHYKYFTCINKGCIVNLAKVKKVVGSEFLMPDGTQLPISRRRSKEVLEAHTRCRFELLDKEVSF